MMLRSQLCIPVYRVNNGTLHLFSPMLPGGLHRRLDSLHAV